MTEKIMNTDFNFDKIGKRLPYSVPENFFSTMEETVLKEAGTTTSTEVKRRRPLMRVLFASVAAAAVALLLVFNHGISGKQPASNSFNDVEQAFVQLNSADQDYMIEVYQNDIFLNE